MSAVGQRLVTLEEFLQMPGNEHLELVRGEVIETLPTGKPHGKIALIIGKLLDNWVEETGSGEAGIETGFLLSRNPTTLRAPDVYYISEERIAQDEGSNTFWTVAPDLVIEVVSPSETVDDV